MAMLVPLRKIQREGPPRPRLLAALVASAVAVALLTVPATPAEATVSVGWRQVATGLGRTVQVTSPRDGTGRLFTVAVDGRIRIVENGSVRSRAYLNISDRVLAGFDEDC